MFAVIRRAKRWSFKPIKVEIVKQNDLKYYVFLVRNGDNIKWEKLSNLLGDLRTRVLFGDGIEEPSNRCVKKASCERYNHKLALNALKKILSHNSEYLHDKSAVLLDIHCKFQAYADVLIEHFKQVTIITSKVAFYRNYSDSKLFECGATISIDTKLSKLPCDTALCVSPSGIILPCFEQPNIPIISAIPVHEKVNAPVYHSFYENCGDDCGLEWLHCDGDSKFNEAALGALYEYCGMRTLGKSADGGYLQGEKMSIEQIKVNIFSLDKKA